MDELKVATKGSLMNEIDFYKEENKNLKGLLEEVYEMSFLDDMIDDACRDREDDEMLLCHLSLKSQIVEALDKRLLAKKLKQDALKTNGIKFTNHKDPIVLADHHSKEVKHK